MPSITLPKGAVQIFIAEFLGTAMLMFVGCSSDIYLIYNAWTFSMAILIVIHIFGPISGAHVNPGATIVALLMGRIKEKPLLIVYWAAQFLGAAFGYTLHYELTLLNADTKSMCLTKPPLLRSPADEYEDGTYSAIGKTFWLELIVSFIFFMATAARFDPKNRLFRESESLKMGFVTYGLHCCMSGMILLSMNTARSLPPALFLSDYEGHWIYWIAPNIAAVLAAGAYRMCFMIRPNQNIT